MRNLVPQTTAEVTAWDFGHTMGAEGVPLEAVGEIIEGWDTGGFPEPWAAVVAQLDPAQAAYWVTLGWRSSQQPTA